MARSASTAGKEWYLNPPIEEEPEYYGSTMLFYQATAPVGWTQVTSNNNIGLRLVTGVTGGTVGGTSDFTTVYPGTTITFSGTIAGTAAGTTGATSLTSPQIPVHSHPGSLVAQYSPYPSGARVTVPPSAQPTLQAAAYGQQSSTSGGPSSSHSHTTPAVPSLTLTISKNRGIRYANVILATRDTPP
jgi:hypothetical protein